MRREINFRQILENTRIQAKFLMIGNLFLNY
jgi:hypothetical protein